MHGYFCFKIGKEKKRKRRGTQSITVGQQLEGTAYRQFFLQENKPIKQYNLLNN